MNYWREPFLIKDTLQLLLSPSLCEPEVNVPLVIRDQASWFLFVPTGITSHLQKRLNASWKHPREMNVLLMKINLRSTRVSVLCSVVMLP